MRVLGRSCRWGIAVLGWEVRPRSDAAGGSQAPAASDAQPHLGGQEHQGAQYQQQPDGVGRRLLEDLGVRTGGVHRGRGDGQVLRGDDLAQPATDGVGGQQDLRVEAGPLGGGGLQVGEQGTRGRLGRTW